ncbi:MAG: FAD-dependent oxidoreductase, partial [Dehalococcoidia bacterium]|nr:FAD-dependent oxidoreductase [Dehalococcoidia bacterium]
VVAVGPNGVRLDDGREIPTRTIVWAGGVRLPDPVASAGLPQRFGGVAVDATLGVEGHPEITVIGDCASLLDRSGKPYPASAQLATQAAPVAAANVAAALRGRPRRGFTPNYLGEAISVGRETAVTRVGPVVLTGFAAAAAKRFTEERYVAQIGGLTLLREWAGR